MNISKPAGELTVNCCILFFIFHFILASVFLIHVYCQETYEIRNKLNSLCLTPHFFFYIKTVVNDSWPKYLKLFCKLLLVPNKKQL